MVIFAIALRAKKKASDWEGCNRRFTDCLKSIYNSTMEDDKSYKKKNFLFIIICLAGLYFACTKIYFSGDDYIYGTFHQEGFCSWIDLNVYSYFNRNGRFLINMLHSASLVLGRYFYIIIMPVAIVVLFVLLAKCAQMLSGTKNGIGIYFSLGYMSTFSIFMKRETFYWIAGSYNYIIPLLLCFMALYSYLRYQQTGKRKICVCIMMVIACASMEQVGILLIGFVTLEHLYRYIIKKEKIIFSDILCYICMWAAWLSIVLAPGTSARAENEHFIIVQNMQNLLYNCFYSKPSCNIIAAISICYYFWLTKAEWLSCVARKIIFLICFLNMVSVNLVQNISTIQLAGLWISVVLLFIETIAVSRYLRIEYGHTWWSSILLAGAATQAALLISEIWGFRTTLCWYLVLILFVLYSVQKLKETMLQFGILICLACNINVVFGIAALIGMLFILKRKKEGSIIFMVCIIVLSMVGIGTDCWGYHQNEQINKRNVERIENNRSNELMIELPQNEVYSWQTFPLGEYHEKYFKIYYGINEDVEIVYK